VRGAWQKVDFSKRLISFAWQSASASAADGFLALDGGANVLRFGERSQKEPLARVNVVGDAQQPALVLMSK
jgi:hypothetical protein